MLSKELLLDSDCSELLTHICSELHNIGPVKEDTLETLAYLKTSKPEQFEQFETTILYEMGLFFKTVEPQNFMEMVYNFQADSIREKYRRCFTPIQSEMYEKIAQNENYSFSAPTSTGKSYLFLELIKETEGDAIVVVPSRALLAEYISTLSRVLPKNVLVLPFIDMVNTKHTNKRVFVVTPERGSELFKYFEKTNASLFLFDEAQMTEEGIRGMKFDSLVRRIDKKYPHVRKVFAHPFVKNPEVQFDRNGLSSSKDSSVFVQRNVGKICLEYCKGAFRPFSPYDDRLERPMPYKGDIVTDIINSGGTCLFYVSKNRIYNDDFLKAYKKYIDACEELKDEVAISFIKQLENYLGSNSRKSHIVSLMKKGIVIHHGSIPLKARLIIEQFVRAGFARLCFSTSTLIQGINMPFDLVWINNFRFTGNANKKILDLKNLIGRAGRSTKEKNRFDVGYIVVESANKETFIGRMKEECKVSDRSLLDESSADFDSDYKDEVEAIRDDTFNTDYNLPESQVQRLSSNDISVCIQLIIDNLLKEDGTIITGQEYYGLTERKRNHVKEAFQKIFLSHMRRDYLTKGEKSILSTAIPIMLWQVQGKSFAEIVSLRYSYLSCKSTQQKLKKNLEDGTITEDHYKQEIKKLLVIRSPKPQQIPDKSLDRSPSDFNNMKVIDLNYDLVIYDTYDYIDKVIGLSLKDVFVTAFMRFFEQTGDQRAKIMSDYIAYGTCDSNEIWLLRYGFSFEDIDWIKPCVQSISEDEIVFNENIRNQIDDESKRLVIERYIQ